jgi:hypothetical protein
MGLPKVGFVQQVYSLHLVYDAVGIGSVAGAQALSSLEQGGYGFGDGSIENLIGRRSGVVSATPWSAARGPQPTAYADWGSGAGVTYTATTVTDTGKAWAVNSQVGRRVTATGTGNNPTYLIITSNTATVLTGAAWTNGTPAANSTYVASPGAFGPHAEGQSAATLWTGAGGRPGSGGNIAEASDNWYKAQMELGNTEAE